MAMTEQMRQAWNAAVEACAADPSEANRAERDRLQREIFAAIFKPHVAEIMPRQYG